ncbi:MAG: Rrf2 family transcriptional regulator [Oscillospiraceae bacterium]
MFISTRGRYALRVMVDLAEHQSEGYIPLREVARRQGISEKYMESIVKLLVKARLLSGVRGKGGGYKLTQPPEGYTVEAILRLTEDSLAPVSCLEEGAAPCAQAAECRTLGLWQGLDRVVRSYLGSVTLADLMERGGGT